MLCRHCNSKLDEPFLDLGLSPPSNALIEKKCLSMPEKYFPLKAYVCEKCWLVQTIDQVSPDELFNNNYPYFSSVSKSWCDHAERFVDKVIPFLQLNNNSFVVEIASNDGYLLKNFVKSGIPCLGIEPTLSTAEVAEASGIKTLKKFFSKKVAEQIVAGQKKADLIIGNNVFAHVSKINDFTKGIKELLAPEGSVTLEFPHLKDLIEKVQFDTVYHEHFSYISVAFTQRIFNEFGLRIWHVESLPTHGGSLRIFGCHEESKRQTDETVSEFIENEKKAGLYLKKTYTEFQGKADKVKYGFLKFLLSLKHENRSVVAYGAAAKGNTLINYAGVKKDLLPYVFDASPFKQGKFLPGSHIPILSHELIFEKQPDYVIILPWNIKEEVMEANKSLRKNGTRFVTISKEINIF